MPDARIARFRKRFTERVFADIGACLRQGQAVGATILMCCAIDIMACYYSGQPKGRLNRQSYISFMEQYFSKYYDPLQFYQFVRCGLVRFTDMTWRENISFSVPQRYGHESCTWYTIQSIKRPSSTLSLYTAMYAKYFELSSLT